MKVVAYKIKYTISLFFYLVSFYIIYYLAPFKKLKYVCMYVCMCVGLTYASNPNYEINSEALSRQSPSGGYIHTVYTSPSAYIHISLYIYTLTHIQNTCLQLFTNN